MKDSVSLRSAKIGYLMQNYDSMRVPISAEERISGSYPYYGAATLVDWVDDYIFDGVYLLVAEDGSVIDRRGCAVVQLVKGKFWANNHAHVLACKDPRDTRYISYAIAVLGIRPFLTGTAQLKLTQDNLKSIQIPYPEAKQRWAIADYLDGRTAQIDGLVERQRRLLDLLREKRSALITAAVCRGLNPNVPLVDSGVEWLGQVPAHWQVRRLKTVARFQYGSALAEAVRVAGPFAVYGSNGVVGEHHYANTGRPALIIGRKGSFGKVHYSSEAVFVIDTAFYIDSSTCSEDLRWLFCVLQCLELDGYSADSAVPGLSRELAHAKQIPMPPLEEQRAIVAYLDEQTARLDAACERIEALIERLGEYRAALITTAVTGGLAEAGGSESAGFCRPGAVTGHAEVPEHSVPTEEA